MALALKALNWKAIGIGTVAAIVLGFVPYLNWVAGIIGGFLAVYIAKSKDFKNGAILGGLSGAIAGLIVGIIGMFAASAVLSAAFGALGGMISGAVGVIAIIMALIVGFVLGAVGGLVGVAVLGKKK